MKKKLILVLSTIAPALLNPSYVNAQEVISQQQCRTNFQGSLIEGVLLVERWSYHDTHRVYGRFHDSASNLIELEVFTNQPGGVGELWFNNARHRAARIDLRPTSNGFVVYAEDGNVAQFQCG
ncbi:MAG: hypothetical protein QNJ46_25835 [Leptolyngbyaceae cyanobacterium MO_188.B28]|nr:hypothetical protein [Leptolyngbyaceae cyanobacterium MO_188.B28]